MALWKTAKTWDKREITQDKGALKRNIVSLAQESYYNFEQHKHLIPLLPDGYSDALKDLRNDKSIKIIRPDKGKGVVVLNTKEYITKMEDILQDNTKFQKLNKDPFKAVYSLENKVRKYLLKLVKLDLLTQKQYNLIRPTGSQPAILYGLPKVHKPNTPLRPVMSSIKTVN